MSSKSSIISQCCLHIAILGPTLLSLFKRTSLSVMSAEQHNLEFFSFIILFKLNLTKSVLFIKWNIGTPHISCQDCFSRDPQLILQRAGASVAKNVPMVDVDSELMNITRKLSNCSGDEFIPQFNEKGEIDLQTLSDGIASELKKDLDEDVDVSAEAKVTGLVSMLFLTHRGFTDIKQDSVPNGKITIKDLWPKINNWDSIKNKVSGKIDEENNDYESNNLRNRANKNKNEIEFNNEVNVIDQ